MYTKITEDIITRELNKSNNKPPLYSSHEFPLNQLTDRDFEILTYYLLKEEISKGKYVGKYDEIFLMQGVGERGRDITLLYKGNNVGVVQCKKYNRNLNKPDFVKEVIKFVLNYLLDNELISDIPNFDYYIAVSSDFSEPVMKLLSNFNATIANEENLQGWVSEVIKKYQVFREFDTRTITPEVIEVLEQINIKRMSSKDINLLLSSNSNVLAHFFTVQKVISTDDHVAHLKNILPSILVDYDSAKGNLTKGVICLEQFLEYQNKKSSKLPFTSTFYGREKDMNLALEQLRNNFLLIVEGVPGIGKTRFCVEIVKRLENENNLVYVLDNNASNFTSLFLSNIEQGAKILLFIDDLNRFENLEELKALIRIIPDVTSQVKIIVNTRNYYTENIVKIFNDWGIEGVSRIELIRLSKKEMDDILNNEPFSIKATVLRKEIISTCKGNPRLASIMAEVVRTDGSIKNKSKYEIFKSYFEGVFSELIQKLEGNYREKVLLAVIAGLRSINNKDDNTLQKLVEILRYENTLHFMDSINTLISFEVIDLNPNTGNIKVFDDSVSEYILFRYFFYNNSLLLSFSDIFSNFRNTHANLMLENLVILVKKGYKSKELNEMIKKLPWETRHALFNNLDNKSEYLEWMPKYAETCPAECFDVVNDYVREFTIFLSKSELNQVLEVCKKVYYKCWYTHLGSILELMRIILNSTNPNLEDFQEELLKFLEDAFSYHVIEVEDDSLRIFFGHQQFVLKLLKKWNKRGLMHKSEIALALSILRPICKNYFTHDTWDYLDDRRFNMTVGALNLSPMLEEIRWETFSLLHLIYHAVSVKDRIQILEILKSPFTKTLHYGAEANEELMKYDGEVIKKIILQIYEDERNLLLIDKIYGVLASLQRIEKTQDITGVLKRFRTPELDVFQKIRGSFWRHLSIYSVLSWKETKSMKKEFCYELIKKWNEDNYKEQLIYFKNIQELLLLEDQRFNYIISSVMSGVANKNVKLGKLILNLIRESDEYEVLRPYYANLLTGIGEASVGIKLEICNDWIEEGDLESIRAISLSFAWNNHHSYSLDDKELINKLLLVNDDQVDNYLMDILKNYQGLDESWVKRSIIILSKRCDSKGFHDLLSIMSPNHGQKDIYNFYSTNIKLFKDILFETVRIPDLNDLSYELANCLEYIAKREDPSLIAEYFISRINSKLNSKDYSYQVIPRFTHQIHFLNELDNMIVFKRLMEVVKETEVGDEFRYQIVELITELAGKSEELFSLLNSLLEEDPDWVGLILDIMQNLTVTEKWLDVVESILEVEVDYTKLNELNRAFYSSGGWTNEIIEEYNFNLDLIQKSKQNTSSFEMINFLNKAEDIVKYMINNEIERQEERDNEFI